MHRWLCITPSHTPLHQYMQVYYSMWPPPHKISGSALRILLHPSFHNHSTILVGTSFLHNERMLYSPFLDLYLDIPSYVYMNKRLKTDAAGIPHRSLDSYQHSPSRAQAFKAPYDSFTSHKSLSPPPSSPPKPPRSYSSTSNYPRGSYPGPNSRMSQQTSENDKSGSLDNSRSHYNSPGTSSTYGNETIATFRLRITAGTGESPRRPPPPPPPTSPGSHDPRVQGVDTYAPDPNRSQSSSTGVSENQFYFCLVYGRLCMRDYPV